MRLGGQEIHLKLQEVDPLLFLQHQIHLLQLEEVLDLQIVFLEPQVVQVVELVILVPLVQLCLEEVELLDKEIMEDLHIDPPLNLEIEEEVEELRKQEEMLILVVVEVEEME